jgi:UDPglucose 6-dehydrogenase
MKFVIAGMGAVGQAVYSCLDKHPNITVYLDDPAKGYENADLEVNGVIVCVATPQAEDGSCYTKNIEDVFEKYGGGDIKYLIKSTINPVFISERTESITVSPEFLRGTVGADPTKEFLEQEFSIFGGEDARFWHEIFKPVLSNLKNVRYTTAQQASFAKYVLNTFLATKVGFFNEMYKIYEGLGYEGFDAMIESICNDPRVGHSHTQVPGPDGQMGFGGHCFPKDISALTKIANSVGVDTPVLNNIVAANLKDRK